MSEENKPTPQSEADKEKELAAKRNAFLRYMTIIFAVAFLLVLISLVLQAHTAKAALSDLKESNSSALSNAAVNAGAASGREPQASGGAGQHQEAACGRAGKGKNAGGKHRAAGAGAGGSAHRARGGP